VFHDIGEAVLVVLMDQFADLEQGRHELQSAAQRLRRSARLG
jgi:predicted regulator of Ras-like GTPase activity (Roadblock/LC7/MglB family)